MDGYRRHLVIILFLSLSVAALGQVPALLNYQGKIAADGFAFNGIGQFKVALLNADGTQTYWLNAADGDGDGIPDESLNVPVNQGLYSILLGDTQVPNMAPIDPGLFSNPEVYLRVWFSDGVNGFQQLSPDQRVASVGYALMGGTVPDGSVSQQKLSPDLANTIAGFSTRLQQLEALASRLQELSSVIGLAIASSENPQDSDLIGRGYQPFYSLGGEQWTAQWIPNSPAPRTGHSTLWTGSEMLLWGGHLGNGVYAQSGGGYDPAADRCTTTAGFATPSPRQSHTAIWTGNEMIVWGGFGAEGYLNTGARYTPDTNRWRPVSSDSAPESSGTETNQGHQASSFGFSKRASSPSNRSPFTIALQIEGNFGFSFRCRFS